MATTTINALTAATTIDPVQDLIPIYQNSTVSTLAISRNNYLNLSSQPVGINDSQTLTNKTLTSPTINSGTLSGTFTGTYTLAGTPTFPSTVVLTTASQTLTNKILTSPTINTPTINTPTIAGGSGSSMTLSTTTMSSSTINSSSLTGGTTVTGGMTLTGGLTADSLTISGVSATTGWNALNQTLTYTGNNGNKEYTLTSTANLTGTLNAGMKLQVTRSTAAPTQSMSFTAASSQYATNASPTGYSSLSAFTAEAWVYLNSYTGQTQQIVGRNDTSSNGFGFRVVSSGQLSVFYGASAVFTEWQTYQSIPTNQWVHVAAVVSSVASKTLQGMYINGVSVSTFSNGLVATSVANTGNLSMGAMSTGVANTFLNGQVSEARVWSTAQTQSQIQANMAINLVGTESGLVGLWRGNGDFTDRTTNANTLTASGGAIATYASNPYNTVEYGIITKAVYGGGVTTLTVYTGNSNNIPNMTLSAPYYSNARAPYGFNADRNNWTTWVYWRSSITLIGTNNSWGTGVSSTATSVNINTGAWEVTYQLQHFIDRGASVHLVIQESLSTNASAETDFTWSNRFDGGISSGSSYLSANSTKTNSLSLTAQTLYYPIFLAQSSDGTLGNHLLSSNGASFVKATCAYI